MSGAPVSPAQPPPQPAARPPARAPAQPAAPHAAGAGGGHAARAGRAPGGPAVVVVGGGHGLAVSLRAVRTYAGDLTAVVTVGDDGGSSGRLREQLGIAPPGDLRKCLVALAGDDSLAARAFEHRFSQGDLAGHPVGNLLLAGLAEASGGDLVAALAAAAAMLSAKGTVLPASTVPVQLVAEANGLPIAGQVAVAAAEEVRRVALLPEDPPVPPEVIDAIEGADQVVLGPGSLYTSVLAAAIAPPIREALGRANRRASVVYVCNLDVQAGETTGHDVAGHVRALALHGVEPTTVLCDLSGGRLDKGDIEGVAGAGAAGGRRPRTGGAPEPARGPIGIVDADLAGPGGRVHDPAKLATALADLVG